MEAVSAADGSWSALQDLNRSPDRNRYPPPGLVSTFWACVSGGRCRSALARRCPPSRPYRRLEIYIIWL